MIRQVLRILDRVADSFLWKALAIFGTFRMIFTQRWGVLLLALGVGCLLGFIRAVWERKREFDEMDGNREWTGEEDEHV